MSRLLREPLLHFLLLGALLFVVYQRVAPPVPAAPDAIVVSRGQIANLSETFARTWQRPPTPAELDGLVQGWVRDEVLYREGAALGLDRGDPVVRNRVRQKVEILGEDAAAVEPGEADLQAWLDAHRADYTIAATYSFEQVYLDPERHGTSLAADVERTLARLRASGGAKAEARPPGDTASDLGDTTLLPPAMRDASSTDVERIFGKELAAALASLVPGTWQGPVPSSYGLHLVRVSARSDARVATLADVREIVARDWQRARTQESKDAYYRALLRRYTVTVETHGDETAGAPLAAAR